MIDWKAKFSSRKLWLAIVGLVTGLLLLFGVDKGMTEQIGGIVLTAGSIVAYIIGEGWADAAHASDHYEFDYGYDQGWDDAVENSTSDAEKVENAPQA